MDPQLKRQLRQTITVGTFSVTANNYGDPGTITTETRKARVVTTHSFVGTPDGNVRNTSVRVVVEKDVADDAIVWLPGDDTSKPEEGRKIEQVVRGTDENGNLDHVELIL